MSYIPGKLLYILARMRIQRQIMSQSYYENSFDLFELKDPLKEAYIPHTMF